jgi:hypothetical protein
MFSTPSTPHAPDLPPLALAPSGQTQRSSGLANRDNPQGFGCLRDEDVDGRDHTSHKLTMSTKMKMDGVGSDLNVNGSGGLRAEVCVMCLFLSWILMDGTRPMIGYVRVLVET